MQPLFIPGWLRKGSATAALAQGGNAVFDLRGIPTTGPRGGRMLAAALLLDCDITITTAGSSGTSIYGAAVCSIIDKLRVLDAVGSRVNLPGTALRAVNILDVGYKRMPVDPGDIAQAATGATANLKLWVPFCPPEALSPMDYGIPVEDLVDRCSVDIATYGNILASHTPTALAVTITPFVLCDEEFGAQGHNRMVWDYKDVTGPDLVLPINGNYVRKVARFEDSNAADGSSAASETLITSEQLGYVSIPKDVFGDRYRYIHGGTYDATYNPFDSGDAYVLFSALKSSDYFRVERDLKFRTDGSGTMRVLLSTIEQGMSPTDVALLKEAGGVKVKTKKGTGVDVDKWPPYMLPFLPLKAR